MIATKEALKDKVKSYIDLLKLPNHTAEVVVKNKTDEIADEYLKLVSDDCVLVERTFGELKRLRDEFIQNYRPAYTYESDDNYIFLRTTELAHHITGINYGIVEDTLREDIQDTLKETASNKFEDLIKALCQSRYFKGCIEHNLLVYWPFDEGFVRNDYVEFMSLLNKMLREDPYLSEPLGLIYYGRELDRDHPDVSLPSDPNEPLSALRQRYIDDNDLNEWRSTHSHLYRIYKEHLLKLIQPN